MAESVPSTEVRAAEAIVSKPPRITVCIHIGVNKKIALYSLSLAAHSFVFDFDKNMPLLSGGAQLVGPEGPEL